MRTWSENWSQSTESLPGSGCGDLVAGWNVAVPLLGLDIYAVGTCHGTAEADWAPDMTCLGPRAGSGRLDASGNGELGNRFGR